MTRDETLTGLADEIAGHAPVIRATDGKPIWCRCMDRVFYKAESWDAHVAAVALAWLEGHGWAEGAEEWGVRIKLSPVRSTTQRHKTEESARAEVAESMRPDLLTLVRRRVTAWAPVEGEKA